LVISFLATFLVTPMLPILVVVFCLGHSAGRGRGSHKRRPCDPAVLQRLIRGQPSVRLPLQAPGEEVHEVPVAALERLRQRLGPRVPLAPARVLHQVGLPALVVEHLRLMLKAVLCLDPTPCNDALLAECIGIDFRSGALKIMTYSYIL